MDTFQKEVTFLSKVINKEKAAAGQDPWEIGKVTKTITLKELNQLDKSQHKLHGLIIAVFQKFLAAESPDSDELKFQLDPEAVYDVTTRAINVLLITDEKFTPQDKIELLNDSGAIYRLGPEILSEKITPFFLRLMTK